MIPVMSRMDLVPADTRIDTRLRNEHVDGNVSDFELDVINRLATFHDPATLFEIGTFDGRTTLNLAAHSRSDARMYTLDLPPAGMEHTALPLEVGDSLFIDKPASGARFASTDVEPKIVQLFGDSAVYDFRRFYGRIDFAFVDGSHAYEYALQDSSTAIRLMRESGVILWHDYVREGPTPWPGVPRALGELYRNDPLFRGLRQIAGTSIVFLQLPGPNSMVERRKASEKPEVGRLDSGQPECLVASLRVKMARTSVRQGRPLVAKVHAVNIGRADWLPEGAPWGPVRLGVRLLDNDGCCIDPSFARSMLPGQTVAPGRNAKFTARIPCPPEGRYILEFDLVAENVAWFSRNGSETVRISIEVVSPATMTRHIPERITWFFDDLKSLRGRLGRIPRRTGLAALFGGKRLVHPQAEISAETNPTSPHAMRAEAFVEALYRVCLGRSADPKGLALWTDIIRSTGDPTCVLHGILGSPEYAGRVALDATAGCAAEIRRARDAVDRPLRVVDVGAQSLGPGSHPYDPLRGVCALDIIGFDPLAERLQERIAAEGAERLTLLPYAVGDGRTHTLYVNNDDATSSLFPLNDAHNASFNHLSTLRTVRTEQVATRRLDDVLPEGAVDFLKLDVQGAELMVLQGAERTLSETAVVHCEVEFGPIYLGQPLFADVQQYLLARGFILVDLLIPGRYHYLTASGRVAEDRLLWADAVFFRDTADPIVQKVQALVAASVYRKPTLSEHLLRLAGEPPGIEPEPAPGREPVAADNALVAKVTQASHAGALADDDMRVYSGFKSEDLAVLDAFDIANPAPTQGFVTDFIGCRSRIASLWDGVQHLDGLVLPKPIPGDYHSETIEWLGVLKSVMVARDRFAGMELGAGMAPWLVVSATAARLRGIRDIRLTGVEADPDRFQLMVQHLRDNGIDPAEQTLIEAAVGVTDGVAKWPRIPSPRNNAGARPVRQEGAAGKELNQDDLHYMAGIPGALVGVNVVSFESLLRGQPFWDLVHIDVQGGEYDLCRACLAILSERVRYIVVGTHSRKLDGDLLEVMWRSGWILEHEKPTRFQFNTEVSVLERMGTHDGTQVWRNPRF